MMCVYIVADWQKKYLPTPVHGLLNHALVHEAAILSLLMLSMLGERDRGRERDREGQRERYIYITRGREGE